VERVHGAEGRVEGVVGLAVGAAGVGAEGTVRPGGVAGYAGVIADEGIVGTVDALPVGLVEDLRAVARVCGDEGNIGYS
jgi:hypothetical protein